MSFRFPIEAGHIVMFARAIGDPNPRYDASATGPDEPTIAPPTFVVASAHHDPEERRRPRFGAAWIGSGREATGIPPGADDHDPDFMRVLHAETSYEYFRPVLAGEVLDVTVTPGRRWEKQGRAGTLHFAERVLDYRDEAGELVVQCRWVDVHTDAGAGAA